jgi:glc operon protein GlcG
MVTISIQDARRVVDSALAQAEELNVKVSVVVVDEGGNLKAAARMDGALYLTTAFALNKAMTAAGLGLPTADLSTFLSGNPALLTGLASQPNIAVIPGGAPITAAGGVVAGAVGVAGGQGGEDEVIATGALAALTGTRVTA